MTQKEAYEKYAENLMSCLPMNDTLFIAKLFKYKLLPGDTENQLQALPTQAAKALHFLNHVIKPGLDIDDTSSFDNLLSVMENCDYTVVEALACEIKSELDKDSDIEAGMDVLIQWYKSRLTIVSREAKKKRSNTITE